MRDLFMPRREPERSIYCALSEASRTGDKAPDWSLQDDIDSVLNEAAVQAKKLNLRTPSREEVARAEDDSAFSADYGAQWVRRVVDAMHREG